MKTKVKIAMVLIFPIYIALIIIFSVFVIAGWALVQILDFTGIIEAFLTLLQHTSDKLRLKQVKKHIN